MFWTIDFCLRIAQWSKWHFITVTTSRVFVQFRISLQPTDANSIGGSCVDSGRAGTVLLLNRFASINLRTYPVYLYLPRERNGKNNFIAMPLYSINVHSVFFAALCIVHSGMWDCWKTGHRVQRCVFKISHRKVVVLEGIPCTRTMPLILPDVGYRACSDELRLEHVWYFQK